jgi:hypothetical protein
VLLNAWEYFFKSVKRLAQAMGVLIKALKAFIHIVEVVNLVIGRRGRESVCKGLSVNMKVLISLLSDALGVPVGAVRMSIEVARV